MHCGRKPRSSVRVVQVQVNRKKGLSGRRGGIRYKGPEDGKAADLVHNHRCPWTAAEIAIPGHGNMFVSRTGVPWAKLSLKLWVSSNAMLQLEVAWTTIDGFSLISGSDGGCSHRVTGTGAWQKGFRLSWRQLANRVRQAMSLLRMIADSGQPQSCCSTTAIVQSHTCGWIPESTSTTLFMSLHYRIAHERSTLH